MTKVKNHIKFTLDAVQLVTMLAIIILPILKPWKKKNRSERYYQVLEVN